VGKEVVPWVRGNMPAPVLSSGTAGDVFGVHGDEVVYDDGAHSKGTESVSEGV